jgi:hypothetical protein
MSPIKQWRTRTKRERVAAPHNATPLTQTLERHVEAGAVLIEFHKERGSNRWEVEATYHVREKSLGEISD